MGSDWVLAEAGIDIACVLVAVEIHGEWEYTSFLRLTNIIPLNDNYML